MTTFPTNSLTDNERSPEKPLQSAMEDELDGIAPLNKPSDQFVPPCLAARSVTEPLKGPTGMAKAGRHRLSPGGGRPDPAQRFCFHAGGTRQRSIVRQLQP